VFSTLTHTIAGGSLLTAGLSGELGADGVMQQGGVNVVIGRGNERCGCTVTDSLTLRCDFHLPICPNQR
jgi:hypothetical protein